MPTAEELWQIYQEVRSLRKVALHFGISHEKARTILKSAGYELRSPGGIGAYRGGSKPRGRKTWAEYKQIQRARKKAQQESQE